MGTDWAGLRPARSSLQLHAEDDMELLGLSEDMGWGHQPLGVTEDTSWGDAHCPPPPCLRSCGPHSAPTTMQGPALSLMDLESAVPPRAAFHRARHAVVVLGSQFSVMSLEAMPPTPRTPFLPPVCK